MKQEKGFTIIELVIVMAIMVIIGGVAFTGFIPRERRELEQTAIYIATDIRHIQEMAIQTNSAHFISFFPIANTYETSIQEGHTLRVLTRRRLVNQDIALVTGVLGGVSQFKFTPRGTVTPAGRIIIQSQNYSIEMTINLGSGRVHIQDPIRRQ